MKLTIVIVNYNVQYFLEQCLLSVQKAMAGLEVEVFVVDNNSVDGSIDMIESRFPWVKLIANKENTGFSKANNQAMRLAQGQYILLLNPDTVIEEDTLHKVITFMDAHPDAGGLGVKMVDGKGNFLPESKRGLPTPQVSFYKIFGLSRLFPKSKRFNQYHLGYLSNDEIHEIEILSGAFMLMRKKALDQVGLLDEAFFMYGEDIDLSWRIIQGGWKNYYFPETRIIHYKGESTKKGSLNYVFVFYNAMVIFAKKHFSAKNAKLFSWSINVAIWLRAIMAVIYRFAKGLLIPVLDVAGIIFGLMFVANYYAEATHNIYDHQRLFYYFTIAAIMWEIGAWLNGANDQPLRPFRVTKPALIVGAMLMIAYSLLPEDMRFSRAITFFSPLLALGVMMLSRVIYNLFTTGHSGLKPANDTRYAIIGKTDEAERVLNILQQTRGNVNHATIVVPEQMNAISADDVSNRLDEIVRVHSIDHIVFCARDLSASEIIGAMSSVNNKHMEFKIAPPESLYIIGSNSIETSGEVFMLDVNSVSLVKNKRTKRILDLGLCLLFLSFLPIVLLVVKNKWGFLSNWVQVLFHHKTWVGISKEFTGKNQSTNRLPRLKPGVLNPTYLKQNHTSQAEHNFRLNVLYAKDYQVLNDLTIIWKGFRDLGS